MIARISLLSPRAPYVHRFTFWHTGITIWLWRVFILVGVPTRPVEPQTAKGDR